ncbi:MAG TPA: DUF4365 domain-containing protein [Nannocystis sp.]
MSQQQRLFSEAYVKAVAAAAGYCTYVPSVDDDSVDMGIAARGSGAVCRSPRVEVQIKSLLVDEAPVGDSWSFYDLKRKNYDDLRHTDFAVPRILVVVRVPRHVSQWLEQTPDALLLRHCGYWVSLRGLPESSNTTKVVVRLPLAQVFTVEQLQGIMGRISKGAQP